MIWIHYGASHHASKFTTEFCPQAGFLGMIWPPQLPNLKLIENIWRIMKIRVNSYRHQAHTVKAFKVAI